MSGERDGLARSVQVRLARHAKAIGVDPDLVLVSQRDRAVVSGTGAPT